MECTQNCLEKSDIPPKVQNSASKRKQPKTQKRRRHGINDDFTVNFSKVKVSESNRVLRSRTRRIELTQTYPQADSVSKDHSYSKASKIMTRQRSHQLNAPTVHLQLFIDLSSSKENSYNRDSSTPKDVDENCYCRNHKIEIIDFDDLELSDPSYEDHSSKRDRNSNDPTISNRNAEQKNNEATKTPPNTPTDNQNAETVIEKSNLTEEGDKIPDDDDADDSRSSKADFEALLAKYGDVDVHQTRSTVFLEDPLWMADADENPCITNMDRSTSQSPVYLDLDQNHGAENSSITQCCYSPTIGPMNFSSGGCFQKLEAIRTLTMTRPLTATNGKYLLPTPMGQTTSTEFETVVSQRVASIIGSKSDICQNHTSGQGDGVISENFPTSGGSIERIFSPDIPIQPSLVKTYPGISTVSYAERNVSTPNRVSESISTDGQIQQQPECRIHLVDTPPSFTRTSQSDVSYIISRPRHTTTWPTSDIISCSRSSRKTPPKPRRTRRTRAQMEMYRQEMTRSYNRSKRSSRFSPRSSGHLFGRNFSMEYHRVHSQPQEFIYTTRMPSRFQPMVGCQTQRYSETYSVNETSLFGASSNLDDWSQTFNHFPGFSHDLDELWSLNPVMKNFPPTEISRDAPSSSSVMWNQQIRSYTTVQQGPLGNSTIMQTEKRSYTPWHQSLDQVPANAYDVENDGSVSEAQYYAS